REPGDTRFEISPDTAVDEPMCATPMPRIEPRGSSGSATPMRIVPGTGVLRTLATCTPGCVMSSVDCGTSTGGVAARRIVPGAGVGVGVGVILGVGFADPGGGTGVPVGIVSGGAGGFDVGRTMISPEVASSAGWLWLRFCGTATPRSVVGGCG